MTDAIKGYFATIYSSILAFLTEFSSKIAIAVAVVIVGFIIANLAYTLVSYFLRFINPMIRWKEHRERTSNLIRNTVYWIILFTFFYWAVISLKLPIVHTWLTNIGNFLPQMLISILIVLTGYVISRIVRTTIIQISSSATMRLTADLIAIFIIAVSILSGLDQIDINASLINALFLITFAMLFGGLIILLIAASYTIVREMMCARFVTDTYTIGQRIAVSTYEGIIEEFNSTSVHINQDGVTVVLPAKMFLENPVTIINDGEED